VQGHNEEVKEIGRLEESTFVFNVILGTDNYWDL
jgi:hypothetical protein